MTPIGFGETIAASINALAELDAYSFVGEAGDVIRVRMGDGSSSTSSIDNRIQLYDAAGVELGSVVDEVDAVLDVTLPAAGTYLILASDAGGNQTQSYGISLQRLNNPGAVTPIGFGETIAASINALAELDAYSFVGEAGDVIRVRMGDGSSSTSSIDNRIQLYDAAGVELGSVVDEVDAVLDVTLPAAGTYLILASDAGGEQTASYSISLEMTAASP